MVLSKRERILAIAAVVVVAALGVNEFILKPVGTRLEKVVNQKQQLLAQVAEGQNLLERRRLLERKWREMFSDGLRNDAEAESCVARAVDEWSGSARLTLTSIKPERFAGDKGLKEIVFTVAGNGSLTAATQFLYEVETTKLPVKIKSMQLSSANESGESMSLQLGLSALYLGAENKPSETQAQPKPEEDNNEEQLL
jgi:Tfp pilus assembly protein PilO